MKEMVENLKLRERIVNPEEAASAIKSGMVVAMGGYTGCGSPKVIPLELIERRKKDDTFTIDIISGALLGHEIDDLLVQSGAIRLRSPQTASKISAELSNSRAINYVEQQMSKMPRLLKNGAFGKLDVYVIEALSITKEGYIAPTSGVGFAPTMAELADSVVVEINTAQPAELHGIHDCFTPGFPPNAVPIPLHYANQRIGVPFVKLDPDKIKYIVFSDIPDRVDPLRPHNEKTKLITDNLLNFLETEIAKRGFLPPFQTGIGNLASAIIQSLGDSNFKDIEFYCGNLLEASMELIASGKVKGVSTGSIQITPNVLKIIRSMRDSLKDILTIRNGEVANSLETTSRLGIFTLNGAIEADIYGNVNTTHIAGSKVVNGIGGGPNFAQCSGLSIIMLASDNKDGKISSIVPMVPHCDIGEHDVDVLITDVGVADLRGKGEVERARAIIENCASPIYKDLLSDYLDRAIAQTGGHHPVLLKEAFDWHERLSNTGSML